MEYPFHLNDEEEIMNGIGRNFVGLLVVVGVVFACGSALAQCCYTWWPAWGCDWNAGECGAFATYYWNVQESAAKLVNSLYYAMLGGVRV